MTLPRWSLTLLIATVLIAARSPLHNDADCSGFKFETELSKEPNEVLSNLTIKTTGGKRPFHYLLLNNDNTLVSKDFTIYEFRQLKAGRYRCIVSDSQDCTIEKFIEVK